MKKLITIISLAAASLLLAQVTVLETETVEITTKRVRVATTFRNNPITGELLGAEVETVIVKSSGTNLLSLLPGPTAKLTAEQITNVLTGFSASQAAFDAALQNVFTNSP